MEERISVAPRPGGVPPRAEDTRPVGVMRRMAAARLRQWGLHTPIDEVMVIVSELLTNAVLHSGATEIILSLRIRDGFLRIAVADGTPGRAMSRSVGDDAESGRGLALVEALVTANGGTWGTGDDGAETWCSLAVPTPARS